MKTKQFNYEEAKQHPELVVYEDESKPDEIFFAKDGIIGIIAMHETARPIFFNNDGFNASLKLKLLLIDTTPEPEPEQPTLKPFNYEAACRDKKVVNGKGEVLEIDFIKRYEGNEYPITIIYSDGQRCNYTDGGLYLDSPHDERNIYLYEPPQAEEPEMWVLLDLNNKLTSKNPYLSIKDALYDASLMYQSVNLYKLIKG